MRQINLNAQAQSRSIDFDLLSTEAAMAILAMKPVEDYVQNASPVSVISGASHVSVSLDGPFLFADSGTYSDQDNRIVNKGKFAFRSTESPNEKAKVHVLNASDNTPVQNAQGKELVAFLRVDVANSNATRLDFHVDNGDGTYTAATVPAGVTSLLFQWLQRFSFDEIRPEVASTKKFFHGVVDVAVDNDLNQLLKDLYGNGGTFNGTGQGSFLVGESVVDRLDGLDTDLASETSARQAADTALQSALDSEVAALEASIAALSAGSSSETQQLQAELDQEILDRIADVDAEETRALAAEALIQSALDAEEVRALAAEAAIQTALDAEETRAQAEEADIRLDFAAADTSLQNTLQTAIDAEETRAQAEEADIRVDFAAADTALQAAIDAEETRALAAEAALSGEITTLGLDLASEVGRALAAEAALQTALDAEETRAMAEEADIRVDFAAGDAATLSSAEDYTDQKIADLVNGAPALLDTLKEIADQLAEDESLVNALTNTVANNLVEAKAYTDTEVAALETALQAEIDAEETRALAAESALSGAITALSGNSGSSLSALQAELDAEEARALAAEAALQAEIDAEETRALAAEAALQSNIDAEETRAIAAEGVLQGNIDAEQARAEAAESVLQDNIDAEETRAMAAELVLTNGLAQEITDRIAADGILQTFLQGEIDAEETRAIAAEAALQAEINAEETRALAAEVALQAAIDAEETRALAAEAALQSAIDAEETRALAAEAVLQSNINTEASARVSGDSNLQSQVDSLLSSLNAYKSLVGKPVDMETVTFLADGSYILQAAPSGIVSGSKPMLAINGVLQEIGGASPDFSVAADPSGVIRKVQLVLGNKTVSGILGPNGTAVIWYRAVI